MSPEERTARPHGRDLAARTLRRRSVTGGVRDRRPVRGPGPGARPADRSRRRGRVPRPVRPVRAHGDGARAPGRAAAVPRGGDRAGGVLGGVAEPERIRPAAGVGPRLADGHGASPCRGRRSARGVAAPARRGVDGVRPRRLARPRGGSGRTDRPTRGAQGGAHGARRPAGRAAAGDRADVLRRTVAVRDLRSPRAPSRHREVANAPGHASAQDGDRGLVSMMRDHSRIEELLAIRSIGGLDPQDEAALEREMASHGPDCEECRRLETEYGEVAGRLAFALEPVPVREGFAEETFERAFGEAAPVGAGRPVRRRAWLRPLVGVAAAVVLFAGGIVVGAAVTGENEQAAETTVVALSSETEPGTLTAAFTPGQPGVYMVGSDLPALPEGKAYELWLFEGETPRSAMCAVPAADGSGFGSSDASLENVGLMAVTVESNACPSAPTTDPVFTAEVTA